MRRWPAIVGLWLVFGLVVGVGSPAAAQPATGTAAQGILSIGAGSEATSVVAAFFWYDDGEGDGAPDVKKPKKPKDVKDDPEPGDTTTTVPPVTTTTTTVPPVTTTTTTVPPVTTTTTTVPPASPTTTAPPPATTTTTMTTTTTLVGDEAPPPGADPPAGEAPAEDARPSVPTLPPVSFVTGAGAASYPTTPLEVVGFAFLGIVEEMRLNLLPAALLGMLTALLVLRPLESRSMRSRGSKGDGSG